LQVFGAGVGIGSPCNPGKVRPLEETLTLAADIGKDRILNELREDVFSEGENEHSQWLLGTLEAHKERFRNLLTAQLRAG